jgi:hypothetical protein
MQAHNTFEAPDAVHPAEFQDFKPTEAGFQVTLPGKSVVVLTLE